MKKWKGGLSTLFLRLYLNVTMITKDKIREIAESFLIEGSELFVVEIKISAGNDIELTLDSDSRVSIDECVKLSRSINSELELQGYEDYSLVVTSAGIGYPLLVERQVRKCLTKMVEVVLKDGRKLQGELTELSEDGAITVSYTQKVAVEGKKRKEEVTTTETFTQEQVKTICELLMIK